MDRTPERQIWKFPFAVQDDIEIEMPWDSTILHVDVQHGVPCLWAEVHPRAVRIKRKFHLYGTGHDMHDIPQKYVGSFQMHDGALVFHLYHYETI